MQALERKQGKTPVSIPTRNTSWFSLERALLNYWHEMVH